MMLTSTRHKLQKELQRIPDDLLEELQDYMQYLQYKTQQRNSSLKNAYASEAVLGKDWNSAEENQAWQSL